VAACGGIRGGESGVMAAALNAFSASGIGGNQRNKTAKRQYIGSVSA
jgi:hypothetical protein